MNKSFSFDIDPNNFHSSVEIVSIFIFGNILARNISDLEEPLYHEKDLLVFFNFPEA